MSPVSHPRLWWLLGSLAACAIAAAPVGWWNFVALASIAVIVLIIRPSLKTLRPLIFASVFALVFLLLRVVYRILFGAASFDGVTLWQIDPVHLAGPFRHVTLWGTVTSGGLLAAALSAVPFVTTILIFGLLNTVADARRLFTHSAGRVGQNVRQALLIGLAAYPALLDAVAAIFLARTLRGERSAGSLFVPVFEQSVERAVRVAASMEVRGYGVAASPTDGQCEAPVVAENLGLHFAAGWGLDNVNFRIEPGTVTVLTGATGSGKTTLLAALTGVFQHFSGGSQTGTLSVGGLNRSNTRPRETAGFVSLVSQDVRSSFVAPTGREEIAYALVVRGEPADVVADKVTAMAHNLSATELLDCPIQTLSAGEATIVAIAAALVTQPSLLLMDEPLADLDHPSAERVVLILRDLATRTQIPVVIAEHRITPLREIATTWLRIVDGNVEAGIFEPKVFVAADFPPARPATARPATARPATAPVSTSNSADTDTDTDTETDAPIVLASIRSLSVLHEGIPVVRNVTFTVVAGEIVAIEGHNGAGKSSLLNAMAQPRVRSTIVVDGIDVATVRARKRRGQVALVPENYEDLLFCSTVAEECAAADRTSRVRPGTSQDLLALLLRSTPLTLASLLAVHPRDLSTGQRLALVIAIQLSAAPRLLLIDEPTRGLDPLARNELTAALHRFTQQSTHTAVVFASHDSTFIERTATTIYDLTDGRLS